MRLKLDENIDGRVVALLREAGHQARTVRDQGLQGTADSILYEHCSSQGEVFVTLDLDFSNVLHYPPARTAGLVVLRGPDDLFSTVRILIQTLVNAMEFNDPSGQLWIVEPARIRIHD